MLLVRMCRLCNSGGRGLCPAEAVTDEAAAMAGSLGSRCCRLYLSCCWSYSWFLVLADVHNNNNQGTGPNHFSEKITWNTSPLS